MGIGTSVLVESDARDAARGDAVHASIAVVELPPPAPGQAFGHLLLGNVPTYKERHPDASFLMPAAEGRIELEGHTTVTYKVVAASGAEQTIETQYKDGDRSAWGRYRATRRDVSPLASRLSVPTTCTAWFPMRWCSPGSSILAPDWRCVGFPRSRNHESRAKPSRRRPHRPRHRRLSAASATARA